jgi:hypothetical protein
MDCAYEYHLLRDNQAKGARVEHTASGSKQGICAIHGDNFIVCGLKIIEQRERMN